MTHPRVHPDMGLLSEQIFLESRKLCVNFGDHGSILHGRQHSQTNFFPKHDFKIINDWGGGAVLENVL